MVDEPVEVHIEEPVKVKKEHNGGMRLTIGYALLSIGIVLGLVFGFRNDHKLQNEIGARCTVSERIIKVLHDEHVLKRQLLTNEIDRQVAYLNSLKNGSRPRLPGVSDKEVQEGIDLRRKDLANENKIVKETRPTPCLLTANQLPGDNR